MHVLLPGTKYFAFIVKLIEPEKFTDCIYLYLHSFIQVCSVGLLLNQQKSFCPCFHAYISYLCKKKVEEGHWQRPSGSSSHSMNVLAITSNTIVCLLLNRQSIVIF